MKKVTFLRYYIYLGMEKPTQPTQTLNELATDFLLNISQKEKRINQVEVYKFIRWLGSGRKPNELNPTDIATYSERITPSEADAVKSFLTYIRKRGFTTINLASHVRPKKVSIKKIGPLGQNSRGETILTEEGYSKMVAELASLKDQRSLVTEDMRKAAADKDFRENAPLTAARERKSHLEGRIQDLEATLKLAKIMSENQTISTVKIGDAVVLCELSSGQKLSYILVDPREANPTKGKLSITSPLGKALLDKGRDQMIEVTAPAGVFGYRIEDIQHS